MTAVNITSLARISVSSAGVAPNGSSFVTDYSGTGRYAVFFSNATNLVPEDSDTTTDVYLRDTVTGATTIVSLTPDGGFGSNTSDSGSISDDGRYVAFRSLAGNLVAGDTNFTFDVFVRDMQSGATFCISRGIGNTPGDSSSNLPQISAEGRFVVFDSSASNLVAGDSNDQNDVFVYDMLTGTTQLISRASDGTQGDGLSAEAQISGDGHYVVFTSEATNLIAGDTNGTSDVFLRDQLTGLTTRISLGTGGAQANGKSNYASLSADGRYVVFASEASNLAAADTNGNRDIFLRDTMTNTTTLISSNSGGVVGNGISYEGDVSANGRYVVFSSEASNLVTGDTNGVLDVFLRDTVAGTTTRLSVGWDGAEANGRSFAGHISNDGRFVSFYSEANNLIRGDVNDNGDVFRISLAASDSADRMIGSDGADTISGLGGADILDGGLGADTLTGGTGNDTFIADNAGDRVVEATGGGIDTVLARVSYTLTAGQEIESLGAADRTGLDTLNLTGNEFANTITGNDGANILNGLGGADRMIGGAGSDTYFVDNAGDKAVDANGAGGVDLVVASVSYSLGGSELENLTLTGTANINGTGNSIANVITGNVGANVLDGRVGADTMIGGAGSDTYYVDNVGDRAGEANGAVGTDLVYASVSFSLAGSELENLTLTGSGALSGTGNGIANVIRGNVGANVLNGMAGKDILTGLAGKDSFVFSAALGTTNVDRITDFSATDDTIQLAKGIFTALSAGALAEAAFKDLSVAGATVDASDRILYNKTTGALFYDADGSGSKAAVQFATIDTKVALTHADFFVV